MTEKVRKEYYRRVRLVLKSELNAANGFEAINTLVVPVVTYSFNIRNWKISEIKRLDTKTRKLLTIHRMKHPKADVNRTYLTQENWRERPDQVRNCVQINYDGAGNISKNH